MLYISWLLLFAAIGAFAFVIYEAGGIQTAALDRASAAVSRSQKLDTNAYSQRLHALASETVSERAALESFSHLDIVSTVQMLESAAASAGVAAKVTDATPQGGGTAFENGETLQSTAFSVSADGSYSALMRAVQLYERLPLASRIMELDLTLNDDAKQTWHMTMRITVLAIATSL